MQQSCQYTFGVTLGSIMQQCHQHARSRCHAVLRRTRCLAATFASVVTVQSNISTQDIHRAFETSDMKVEELSLHT